MRTSHHGHKQVFTKSWNTQKTSVQLGWHCSKNKYTIWCGSIIVHLTNYCIHCFIFKLTLFMCSLRYTCTLAFTLMNNVSFFKYMAFSNSGSWYKTAVFMYFWKKSLLHETSDTQLYNQLKDAEEMDIINLYGSKYLNGRRYHNVPNLVTPLISPKKFLHQNLLE